MALKRPVRESTAIVSAMIPFILGAVLMLDGLLRHWWMFGLTLAVSIFFVISHAKLDLARARLAEQATRIIEKLTGAR